MSDNRIPATEREADFKQLDKLILSLEHNADTNQLTVPMLKNYQQSLDKLTAKYKYDPSFGRNDRGLFKPAELHALIFLAQGNEHMADALLREGKSLMKPDEEWVSKTARKWDEQAASDNSEPEATSHHFSGKLEGMLAIFALNLIVSPLLFIYAIFQQSSFQSELDRLNPSVASNFNSYTSTAYVLYVITIIAMIGLAYPFFTRMKVTKPLAIGVCAYVFIAGVILFSMYDTALQQVGSSIDAAGGGTGSSFSALSIIWVFYWIFSKRVKATFVK